MYIVNNRSHNYLTWIILIIVLILRWENSNHIYNNNMIEHAIHSNEIDFIEINHSVKHSQGKIGTHSQESVEYN